MQRWFGLSLLIFSACADVGPFQGPWLVFASDVGQVSVAAQDHDFLYLGGGSGRSGQQGQLVRVDKQSGEVSTLARSLKETVISSLIVDGAELYFAAVDTSPQGTTTLGQIARVNKVTGELTTIATNENRMCGVAVDETNVYWGEQPGQSSATLMMAPRAGGASVVIASSLDVHTFCSLTLADGYLYWHSNSGLQRVAITGGAPETLGNNDAGSPDFSAQGPPGIERVGDHLYYVTTSRQELRMFDFVSGAAPVSMAPGEELGDVAVGGGYVYVVRQQVSTENNNARNSRVRRVHQDGDHSLSDFSLPQSRVSTVVADEKYVYWTHADEKNVYRAPHDQ